MERLFVRNLLVVSDPAVGGRTHPKRCLESRHHYHRNLVDFQHFNCPDQSTAKRARPFVYNPDAPLGEKQNKDARYSFFSGHTSGTACLSVVAAKIWSDYHPGSGWKPLVWSTALAWPAAVGILRVKAGKHFPTDVLVGYAVGFACGYFLPKIHFKN